MPETGTGIPRHLRTDLHMHTTFSDGRADVAAMLTAAQQIGFEIGISDHYSTFFGMKGDDTLSRYLDAVEAFPVYRAIELDLGQEQEISPLNMERLDYCVGSMHTVIDEHGERVRPDRWSSESMRRYMECAVRQFEQGVYTGIHGMLGHPTFLPDLPRDGQDELWVPELRKRVIAAVVETGVALELSTRYKAPNETLIREAFAAGARFAVASDSHRVDAVGAVDYARKWIAELRMPDDRFFLPERRLSA